ncbi:MAG: class I SAM-dependent methyltransferase [Chloroflexi bacterium]|nr:class I SAM-dependent methyltransferase [Chloroflexota bacterium]
MSRRLQLDIEAIKRKYRRNAVFYNIVDRPLRSVRERAVAKLELRPGDSVLDFGCGTGLSLVLLQRAVGQQGRVLGVDASPDMLARARRLVAQHGWTTVRLVEANAEDDSLETDSVDAVLCFYTHDILQSDAAIERALAALRPGGRIVAAGARRTTGVRGLMLNPVTMSYSRTAITNLDGFDRPWARLERRVGPFEVEERLLGTAYIARGIKT